MDSSKNKFLQLVRAGLWGTVPPVALFDKLTDWNDIYNLSKQQAVLGVALDGINLLPANLRPPRLLYLKWCAEVLEIEDENHRLDKEMINLFSLLEENGTRPVLMKGQGVARNYPYPLHRTSGDIDIFVGKEDYDKVNNLLAIDGKALEKWSPKHLMFEWHDVVVENHRLMVKLNNPATDKKIQRIIEDWYLNGKTDEIIIEGYKITLPPIDFDLVFLLLHSVVHLMGFGVGLRQVCDWAMMLHTRKGEINKQNVLKILKKLGLVSAARIFGALSVKYLGLPEEDLVIPFKKSDIRYADQLLNDIWYNGNFGFSGERIKKRPGGYVVARLYNLFNTARRAYRLSKIAPGEALWAPYVKFTQYFLSRWDKN